MRLSTVCRARGGGGRCAACPYRRRQGPQRLRGQGRPQAVAQRCVAPLGPEGRPRSLRDAHAGHDGVAGRVSGGEAASCWGWHDVVGCW
jgi:hypothetical protein